MDLSKQLPMLLKGLGVKVESEGACDKREAIRGLAESAADPQAHAVHLKGTLKGGKRIHAVLLITD